MVVRDMGCEYGKWKELTQGSVQRRVQIQAMLNLWILLVHC
jgi:hypothetical protein